MRESEWKGFGGGQRIQVPGFECLLSIRYRGKAHVQSEGEDKGRFVT